MSARFGRILGATACAATFGTLLWIALHFAGHRSQGSANPDVVGNDNSSASVPSLAFSTVVEADAPEPDSRSVYRGPKFDSHAHINADAAMAAKKFLLGYGIGGVVNLSGGWAGVGLEESLAAARATGEYYVVFANINFEGIGTRGWAEREVAQLERAKAMGARGVKIFKNLGLGVRFADGRRVPVDHPVLDPLFGAMARLRLPLAIHTGDPKAFFEPIGPVNERVAELASHPMWSFADRDRFPPWEALYAEFERRVRRSWRTTIIGVHFGNAPEDPERVLKLLDDCPNYYVDTAARIPELGRRAAQVRSTILAHPDRVLFGTDIQIGPGMLVLGAGPARGHSRADVDHFFSSSWEFFETSHRAFRHPTPIQGDWSIDGIDLPLEVLENIYHKNAERLLGLSPIAAVTESRD
jgi:predicted TIM-barrel fold metal-dependent hydrolase